MPLMLGTDKKRLSKRHGATSVTEYERMGYLSEAMVNFLGLLGWSPGGDREVMSRDELIAPSTLDGISGGDAVFNPEKLDWFNSSVSGAPEPEDLADAREAAAWRRRGLWDDALDSDEERMAAARADAGAAARAPPCRISWSRRSHFSRSAWSTMPKRWGSISRPPISTSTWRRSRCARQRAEPFDEPRSRRPSRCGGRAGNQGRRVDSRGPRSPRRGKPSALESSRSWR